MESPGDWAMSIPGGDVQLEEGSEKFQLYSNRAKGSGGRRKCRERCSLVTGDNDGEGQHSGGAA